MTEVARNFSEFLNRVRFRRERFIIERNGKPICEVSPLDPSFSGADLASLLRSVTRPDEKYLDDVEDATRGQSRVAKSPWG